MKPETRAAVFARAGYICEVCGKPLTQGQPQIAHRIHKGIYSENRIMNDIWYEYGKNVGRKFCQAMLGHELNLKAVCSAKCNDKCNLAFNKIQSQKLIKEIYKKITEI
jgi:hypothetical protein